MCVFVLNCVLWYDYLCNYWHFAWLCNISVMMPFYLVHLFSCHALFVPVVFPTVVAEDSTEGTDEEDEDTDDYEEDRGTGDDDEDDGDVLSAARPRRMSELHISSRVRPIPPSSSLFLFSSTSR